ncbi:MAG: pentapeptide repeat-containing protein [Verrucomicrobia bacterium]|nr:pentapeptide repeat-containing protein [Verrucomicrobiota bacterium]
MGEDSNLPERVAALERTLAARRGPGRKFIGAAVLLLFAALLAWNVWLLRDSLAVRRQATLERQFWVVGHGAFPAKQRADAFVALVIAGNRDWRGARLDGLKLSGVSMPSAELSGGDFTGSDLSKAMFAGAKLAKAKFASGDLSGANLSGADLSGADLLQTRLQRAQLRRTKFTGANLEQVDAQDAVILAADFTDAILYLANLSRANLAGSDLTGASLEAAVLRGANLSLARLTNVNLKDADFTDANWWRARGLTSQQLVMLAKRFSPSDNAPAALRDDYFAWLRKNEPPK